MLPNFLYSLTLTISKVVLKSLKKLFSFHLTNRSYWVRMSLASSDFWKETFTSSLSPTPPPCPAQHWQNIHCELIACPKLKNMITSLITGKPLPDLRRKELDSSLLDSEQKKEVQELSLLGHYCRKEFIHKMIHMHVIHNGLPWI